MTSRRTFLKQTSLAGIALSIGSIDQLFAAEGNKNFAFESKFIKIGMSPEIPKFTFISTDSLGGSQFKVNPLLENAKSGNIKYTSKIKKNGISYYTKSGKKPSWKIRGKEKELSIKTRWIEGENPEPLNIVISQKLNHCTVLGTMAVNKQMQFPCVLHFPNMGTFRVYCSDPDITMFYDACRNLDQTISPDGKGKYEQQYVEIALPAADAKHPDITYTFESTVIFPELNKIKNDVRFDGFRKNFINIFQLNPRIRALANNSSSDACTFTLFLYTELARFAPELVKGLTAMDLVRNTLDRYIDGMKGYGQVGYPEGYGWPGKFDSTDSMPSLIISACYYILQTKDNKWAAKNYASIKAWADAMIATDRNNDGIIEYGYSGNANSWKARVSVTDTDYLRPANWWDTVGFGHDDAYSNALAYRALTLLSDVTASINKTEDSKYYSSFASKLKGNYFKDFYNPNTGVLGGWRSEDGKLHDYYFTFVNSIAICYGLIEDDQAKRIMSTLLVKMKEVGFTDFRLGLPGNLIPIRREDYTDKDKRYGYGEKEDGSDGFQIYENGGATGCYAYFTLHALFKIGMRKEAEAMFFPMMDSYNKGEFDGNCPGSEMTKDWKTWSGECWGYEGFLVDNYLPLLAVMDL
jgi:hypothetical protein